MDLLMEVNAVAKMESKPILKIKDMVLHKPYAIVLFKPVFSKKLNKRLVIAEVEEYLIFLPNRLTIMLDDEKIAALNKQQLSLVYRGEKNVNKGNPGALLEFVPFDVDNNPGGGSSSDNTAGKNNLPYEFFE